MYWYHFELLWFTRKFLPTCGVPVQSVLQAVRSWDCGSTSPYCSLTSRCLTALTSRCWPSQQDPWNKTFLRTHNRNQSYSFAPTWQKTHFLWLENRRTLKMCFPCIGLNFFLSKFHLYFPSWCYLRSPGWWCRAPGMAQRPIPDLWDWSPAVCWDPPRSCACLLNLMVDYALRDTWSPILRGREAKDKCIMMHLTDLTSNVIMLLLCFNSSIASSLMSPSRKSLPSVATFLLCFCSGCEFYCTGVNAEGCK